jgi:hypothetical protein
MPEGDVEAVSAGSPPEQHTAPEEGSPAEEAAADRSVDLATAANTSASSPPASPPPAPSPPKQRTKLFFDASSDEDEDVQQSGPSRAGPSSDAMDVDPAVATDDDDGEDEVDDWRAKDAKLDAEMLDQIERIDAACRTPPGATATKRSKPSTSSKGPGSSVTAKARAVKLDDSDSDIEYVAGHTGFTPTKKDGNRSKGQVKAAFNFGKPVKKEAAVMPKEPVESDLQRRKRLARELREGQCHSAHLPHGPSVDPACNESRLPLARRG